MMSCYPNSQSGDILIPDYMYIQEKYEPLKSMTSIILSGVAWILMDFFSHWFGWHTSNRVVLEYFYMDISYMYEQSLMHEFKTRRMYFRFQKLLLYVSQSSRIVA